MQTTEYFRSMEQDVQTKLLSNPNASALNLAAILGPVFLGSTNRSTVYEIYNGKYILKQLVGNGKRDSDINALLDLEGIEYFPKLYAYKEFEYLIMEKVEGACLRDLLETKNITETELLTISKKLEDATRIALEKKRFDDDFKIEHLYWDKENQNLRLIDLGLYDQITYYPSFEDMIANRVDYFKDELIMYGFNL